MIDNVEVLLAKIRLLSIILKESTNHIHFIVDEPLEKAISKRQKGFTSQVSKVENKTSSLREVNCQFLSKNKVYLALGDKVQLVNTTKISRARDFRFIAKFHKNLVSICLENINIISKRSLKNLLYCLAVE